MKIIECSHYTVFVCYTLCFLGTRLTNAPIDIDSWIQFPTFPSHPGFSFLIHFLSIVCQSPKRQRGYFHRTYKSMEKGPGRRQEKSSISRSPPTPSICTGQKNQHHPGGEIDKSTPGVCECGCVARCFSSHQLLHRNS